MSESYQIERLDHFGIVAGVCNQIDLIRQIDQRVAQTDRKVTVGQAVQAMVINALGFVGRPLYLTPEFYANKPVEQLIGEGIKAEDLNEDSLGRALDHLFEAGVTEVFAAVASHALSVVRIRVKRVHMDTTAFSLQGEYEVAEDDEDEDVLPIQIMHGYSRDHRPDLKQAILSLICANQSSIPVWLAAASGNETDKAILPETARAYLQQFSADDETPYLVADSAFYSEETIQQYQDEKWITRVPATLKAAHEMLRQISPGDMQALDEPGYFVYETPMTYGEVAQRWLLVLYEPRQQREQATLQRRIDREAEQVRKALAKLQREDFACEADAHQAAGRFQQNWKYHQLSHLEVFSVIRYGRAGRPGPETPAQEVWKIRAQIVHDQEAIQDAQARLGKYIIATNELDETRLPAQEMLAHYKEQNQSVERGFRFLKDPFFFASRFFLKKPSRIMALMMVMGISLLVYALAEHFLRHGLQDRGETVPDQKGKPTDRPTMRRIFQVFEGIDILIIQQGDTIQRLIVNLTNLHEQILSNFSQDVQRFYLQQAR